jgi:hypothetical protein
LPNVSVRPETVTVGRPSAAGIQVVVPLTRRFTPKSVDTYVSPVPESNALSRIGWSPRSNEMRGSWAWKAEQARVK